MCRNVASYQTGDTRLSHYAASKAGIIGFSKSIAKELAQFGIRCNAILPGFIDTPMVGNLPEEARNALVSQIPLARMGRPEGVYSPSQLVKQLMHTHTSVGTIRRCIDVSRYLSRDSYRDTVCKYRDT